MNDQLRRYLSEDWDIDEEAPPPERDTYKPAKPVAAQNRRQQAKQRGKAIAKHLKAINKQRKDGKP